MCHLVLPRDSKRHPLNSADGSVVRHTKRYTLTRRVATATATTLITISPSVGFCDTENRKAAITACLAQFGLTPKSRRGLGAREVGKHTKPLAAL
jgi:hypothetical protein